MSFGPDHATPREIRWNESGIKATYRKGIIEVVVPLSALEPAGRQIEITKDE